MTFPYVCPVCNAIGSIYPDHNYPEIMVRCAFNCGTRGARLKSATKTDNNPQLYITSACYRRFLEQWQEQQGKAA